MGNSASSIFNSSELDLVYKTVVPEFGYGNQKGQHGHIAVIGGSTQHSGAPYYAAKAALNLGTDLVSVYSTYSASHAIKSYSADLLVDPILPSLDLCLDLGLKLINVGAHTSPSTFADFVTRYCSSIAVNVGPTDRAYIKKQCASLNQGNVTSTLGTVLQHLLSQAILTKTKNKSAIVVGPGLGNDEITVSTVSKVLEELKLRATPVVIDGDGITLLTTISPDTTLNITDGFDNMIITTNTQEFLKLAEHLGVDMKDFPASSEKRVGNLLTRLRSIFQGDAFEPPVFDGFKSKCYSSSAFIMSKYIHSREPLPQGYEDFDVLRSYVAQVHALCKKLGGPTIVLKGVVDIIVNKYHAVVVIHPGSPKRCGGLGDVLAGSIAGFASFFNVKNQRVYASYEEPPTDVKLLLEDDTINSAVLGCVSSKIAQRTAFEKAGRALSAADVVNE